MTGAARGRVALLLAAAAAILPFFTWRWYIAMATSAFQFSSCHSPRRSFSYVVERMSSTKMWICLLLLLEGARSFVSHHRTNTSPSVTLLGGSRLYANSESSLDEEFEENEPSPRRRNMFQATSAAASILQSVMTSGVDPAQAATESNDVYFGPATPFSSRRQYKTIQLNNGLRVLLVSDKQALRASAAMSIEGAGQFQEPRNIPGLAHLTEHMTLSSYPERDFEDWLEDKEGASNAFTAPGYVCFHFNCPPEVFGEALSRFASLFVQSRVERVCRNKAVLTREIRRVDSELDYTSEATQKFYLSKALLNPDHPFSRFNAGNLESLERATYRARIDVSQGLIDFFQNHYLPSKAVLVVVCPTDVIVMDRWTSFVCKNILSRKSPDSSQQERAPFPEAFSSRSKPTQIVLYRTKSELFSAESTERLSIEWPLKLDYSSIDDSPIITAPAVGFIVSQIVARRGPGSLYLFLLRRKWVPKGSQGLPRITFPVDVSGFQMMKLEILVTMEGFANRSTIVAAVYDSLKAVRRISQPEESFLLPKTLLNQYLTVARLHGYVLAPRPPDAVELAVDAQTFGLEQVANPSVWPLFPPADDVRSIQMLRQVVADTLKLMCDPTKGIVFITASNKAIQISGRSIIDESLPRYISSEQWLVEPTTGARYFREDRTKLPAYVDEWIAARLDEDELLPPALNPLIPTKLRRPRPVLERKFVDGNRRFYYLEAPQGTDTDGMYSRDSVWREFTTLSTDRQVRGTSVAGTWENRATSSMIGTDWMLWQSSALTTGVPSLPLPVSPPEPTCRCAFVVQLLSSRPARANVKQAADSQLWLRSFENRISDLAELGAPAGLEYAISFNKFGLRICFLGISQNIASYARRFCRRLVIEHTLLFKGPDQLDPTVVDTSVFIANRATSLSPLRKRQIISKLKESRASEVALEGYSFLKSCSSAIVLAQGDLLPKEAVGLVNDLQGIFVDVMNNDGSQTSAVPPLGDVLYKPYWKPRSSSCSIPGVPLVSNACGRIQR